jgi:hypothetical protein
VKNGPTKTALAARGTNYFVNSFLAPILGHNLKQLWIGEMSTLPLNICSFYLFKLNCNKL